MPKQRANVKTDSKDLRCTKQSFIGPNNYSPVHPSKASMMGHFGGVLGEWVGVCVYKRVGWVSHFLPPRILLFNSQGLRVLSVKGETLIMN
jgi:hypothetical protein